MRRAWCDSRHDVEFVLCAWSAPNFAPCGARGSPLAHLLLSEPRCVVHSGHAASPSTQILKSDGVLTRMRTATAAVITSV